MLRPLFALWAICSTLNAADLSRLEPLLGKYCTQCHGNGKKAGGFDARSLSLGLDATTGQKLRERVVELEDMPENYGELDAAQKAEVAELRALVKTWTDEGGRALASYETRPTVSNAEIITLIHNDLVQNPTIAAESRYLSLHNLYDYRVGGNPVFSSETIERFADGMSKIVNSISWNKAIVPPEVVPHSRGLLLRVRLSNYTYGEQGLTAKLWEKIGAADPYQIQYESDAFAKIKEASQSGFPVIRSDFFAVQATKDFYYEALGFTPFTLPQVEKSLLGGKSVLEILKSGELVNVTRAGFLRSGVSSSNRMIERHEIRSYRDASYWLSYDFAASEGKKQLAQNPLGPEGAFKTESAFKHDGGEVIFTLPNGLHAFLLANAKGELLVEAPFHIVRHPDKGTIFNSVSCFDCHRGGLINKGDEVRKFTEGNRDLFANGELDLIRGLYPDRSRDNFFDRMFSLDNERYAKALAKTAVGSAKVAPESNKAFEPVTELTDYFAETVTLDKALSEIGLSKEDFQERLRREPGLRKVIGAFAQDEPVAVDRQAFKKIFPKMIEALGLAKLDKEQKFRIGGDTADRCENGKVFLLYGNGQKKAMGQGPAAMDRCLATIRKISRSDLTCACER